MRRLCAAVLSVALPATAVLAVVVAPPALADTTNASVVLAGLTVSAPQPSGYDRDLFGTGWDDADGDGCDTRAEVLEAESAVPVTYSSGCTVATGQWTSPYDGAVWTAASDVDIDHMVPLGEAWASGARSWTASQRLAYANDLDFGDALIAVTDNVNQSKGDRDPAQWLPPLSDYRCTYATDWVLIKYRWNLSIDPSEKSALAGLLAGECGAAEITLPVKADTPSATATWPLYLTAYSGVIYELVDNVTPTPISYARWRDVYQLQRPQPAATDYVKYPWSASLYAVTFWPGGENAWLWQRLTFGEWSRAGQPAPRIAAWIKGSFYYQWGTSAELFVRGDDDVRHKLTYDEWRNSGFRSFAAIANLGWQKLSWAPQVGYFSNVGAGQGYAVGFPQWQLEAFPTPRVLARIPGDRFYQNAGNATIYYSGPLYSGAVTFAQWSAAGQPAPEVIGTPPPPNPPTPPTNPPVYGITPGAFCANPGQIGYSSAGNQYVCSYYSDEGRYRWRRA